MRGHFCVNRHHPIGLRFCMVYRRDAHWPLRRPRREIWSVVAGSFLGARVHPALAPWWPPQRVKLEGA